ncbi:MAG: hypothetical protein ACJAUL_003697 [Paraglaciecola sp.]|jgi:hypothetical protein
MISGIVGYFDATVANPRPLDAMGRVTDAIITVISRLTLPIYSISLLVCLPIAQVSPL